ncbi:Predicted oxidoreductase related to nitroreductase [gamma proteobacterium HdN1]|nr:Predicted oxidoreductase related to nitroreductase [gamma proteobacterium HdN1]
MNIIEILKKRRTQYALGNKLPISEAAVESLIKDVVREAPSAFNSQSSRVVILFGEEHKKLWSIVKETLRAIVPADAFEPTDKKINSFAAGAGTVLFFEDHHVIRSMQEKFPLYADKFPIFSGNSAGMAQYAVWTALANENIGASLQHYNPLIDAEVGRVWGLPESWELSAQMPFGSNEAAIADKTFVDDGERFRVFR